MKLYTFPFAPNPMKVNIYLGEKGIEIPRELVNLTKGEQKQPGFLAMNPMGALPVLELDDGSRLRESLAIIEYFEELHPEPPMLGRTPLERARVRAIERTIEFGVLSRVGRIVHNRKSPLPGVVGIPEVAEREAEALPELLGIVDEHIGDGPFVCGDAPTIADCTLYAAIKFGSFFDVAVDDGFSGIHRWYEEFSKRPSVEFPSHEEPA